jgi:4-hydroxybenzoate polyprenyltransferase
MLSDWLHFTRPSIWLFVLAVYAIAFFAANATFSPVHYIGIVVFILLCTVSITVNHYFDYKYDRKSKQLYRFPVASGKISRNFAGIFSFLLIAISITLSYTFFPLNAFYLVLFAVFMIITYSAPPARIKARPYLETVWNGLGYGSVPYYLALAIIGAQKTAELHLLGLIPFLIAASGHILLQIRDIRDDKRSRTKTTSAIIGQKRMIAASKLMIAFAGLIIAYLTFVGFLSWPAWISLGIGASIFTEHRKMKDVRKSYKILQVLYIIGGLLFITSLV